MRRALPLLLLLAALTARAQDSEGPYFVYLGSFSTKAAAQTHAARHGGWVLRTDLYRGLTPGFFAAVLGDLVVDVTPEADVLDPCAPAEPHLTVLVGFEQTRGRDDDAPAAGFWLIERTGEVRPMVRCGE